jgi:phosphatidate cytidylyltransferase
MMNRDLQKRILTSIFLFAALVAMILNKFILMFFLINIFVISLIEFNGMVKKIFKQKFIKIFTNLVFIIYISIYVSIFYIFNQIAGLKILLYLCLFICIFSDIGGLLFGRYFKGPKLTKISPKKTISGSLGSFVFSIVISFFFLILFPNYITVLNILILTFFVSIGCQIGDLTFSYFKRKARLKDTGNLLPGHGGILDRIDGILIGIPFGLIFFFIINYYIS